MSRHSAESPTPEPQNPAPVPAPRRPPRAARPSLRTRPGPRPSPRPRPRPGPPTTAPPAQTEPPSDSRSDAGLLRTTGSLALPTLISRITGFGKVVALAYIIGLDAVTSAFSLANTLPNIISELVLGAVLTSIVIPVLVRAEREDPDGGTRFIRRLFTVAATMLVAATVAAIAGASLLTDLYTSDEAKLDLRLVTHLAVLFLPQIIFYGFSALSGAVLNTRGVFGLVAWAPVLNNIIAILTLVVYALTPGELAASYTNPRLLVLGIGTTLGIVAQAVVVIPALRRTGVNLRPLWGLDPRLKRFGGLAAAVVAYVLVAQVGVTVTLRVAGAVRESDVVLYNNAWLLLQVPYGVLGVSLLTAIMPRMSRAAAGGDDRGVVADLSLGSRLSVVALMPVVVLFTLRGTVLGTALFDYGAADGANASRLGATVAASAFGLIPYAVVLLQLRVFYARQQAWVPTLVMAAMVAVKVPLLLLAPAVLPTDDVVLGLAAINGACFLVGAGLGVLLLRRALGPLGLGALGRTTGVVLGAGLVGALVDVGVSTVVPLDRLTATFGSLGAVAEFTVHAVLVLGVTVGLALRFRLPELAAVQRAISGVVARVRPPADEYAATDTAGNTWAAQRDNRRGRVPYPYARAGGGLAGVHGRAGGDGVSGDTDLRGEGPPNEQTDMPQVPTQAAPDVPEAPRGRSRPPRLVPGASVIGGRYRLLSGHGGVGRMSFWQAKDTTLDRDVALTFIATDPDERPDRLTSGPEEVLRRTRRLGGIAVGGLARVLDVVQNGPGAVVVAEWTPGRSLTDVAKTGPSAVGAARAVRTLAESAEAAHRNSTVLGLDHPDRVRISYSGAAVLAFPGVAAGTDIRSDVAGLGAVLYGLITAHWPMGDEDSDGLVGGLPLAPRTASGAVVEPRELSSAVPYEISAVTLRALSPDGGLRTAAAMETVLEQAAVLDQQTDMFPVIGDGYYNDPYPAAAQSPVPVERPSRAAAVASSAAEQPAAERDPASNRRTKLAVGVGSVVVVLGVVLVLVLNQLTGLFGGGNDDSKLPALRLNPDGTVITDEQAPPAEGEEPAEPEAPPAPAAAIGVAGTTIYSPGGEADRPQDAGLAVDGNPGTVWATDNYRQPMGALKRGVGVMIALANPTTLTNVKVDSPSPGTVVEVRTSPTENPVLEETNVVGTATLPGGATDIPVEVTEPTPYVLLWVTGLSTANGGNQSDIGEITLTP